MLAGDCVETVTIIKYYVSLLFMCFTASIMPSLFSASKGKRFRLNLYRFLLSAALVVLLEGFVSENFPRYARAILFFVAFYAEEVYEYAKKFLFLKIRKKFEDKYFKDDSDAGVPP